MNANSRRRPVDAVVDADLLQKAARGNKLAIKEVCRGAAKHVKAMAAWCDPVIDDLTPYVVSALERIGAGVSPNEAFGWPNKSGRQPSALELRNYNIKCDVQRFMKDEGMSLTKACEAYWSKNVHNGEMEAETIEKHICKGLTAETDLSNIPDDIFPLPPLEARRGPGWD